MCEKSVVKKRGADLNYMALRELRDKGGSYADAAEELGLSDKYITNCASGTPEAMLSMPNFIKLIESFKLTQTINNICLRAGGVFVKAPVGVIDEKAILAKYSKVLREEGEDADKIATLSSGKGTEKERERAIEDLTETMQEIAGLIEMLKRSSKNG